MNIIQFKRLISYKIKNETLLSWLRLLNLLVFHWKDKCKITHPGKNNPDKIYYIIRSRGKEEGLISSYLYVIASIKWATDNGYVPYVDFSTNDCQYHVNYPVNGSNNAWNYYFLQPEQLNSEDILTKKNVLLSGWNFRKKIKVPTFQRTLENINSKEIRELCNNLCPIQPYILKMADEKWDTYFKNEKCLAVFLRGTDYTGLKPKGHYIQPSIEQVCVKIDEFIDKYRLNKIFVVTEDYSLYKKLLDKYPQFVFSVDNSFVKDYSPKDYVANYLKGDPYINGLRYLVRLILMSRCDYLIAGITNGSLFSLAIKKNEFIDCYWFNLGLYE